MLKQDVDNLKKNKEVVFKPSPIDDALKHHFRNKHPHILSYVFHRFAKRISEVVGNAWAFCIALFLVIIWGMCGYFFNFSDTWQLIINTATTIITFLVVFLIQNTQNRDVEILNIKLDELIRAQKSARNHIINLESLEDDELKSLEKEYIKLCKKRGS